MQALIRSIALLLGGALLLTACSEDDDTPTYRYRLTVEVDTPEGLRTGSSVIEVETDRAGQNAIPTPGRVTHRLKGEAAAVDLGEPGVLFALLRSESEVDWANNVMFLLAPDPPQDSEDRFAARFDAMLDMEGPIELPRYFPDVAHLRDRPARPMLVTFGDIDDPTSVERVDHDGLAATFGEGVELRRITVEMTDDPVTTGIEERLGWLEHTTGTLLSQPKGTPIGNLPIEYQVGKISFVRSDGQ